MRPGTLLYMYKTLNKCGRLNALVWFNAWPEHPVMERWERRFDWLGRYLCCNLGVLLLHASLFAAALSIHCMAHHLLCLI